MCTGRHWGACGNTGSLLRKPGCLPRARQAAVAAPDTWGWRSKEEIPKTSRWEEPRAGGRGPELVGLGDVGVTVGACLLWSAEARRQKALTVFLSPRGSRGADIGGESIGLRFWIR